MMQDGLSYSAQLVLTAIHSGAQTFDAIAANCAGLYPGDVRAQLDFLVSQGCVTETTGRFSLTSTEPSTRYSLSSYSQLGRNVRLPRLPEPHPHDYDWRFDSTTARFVAARLSQGELPNVDRRMLLLGAPTVFRELQRGRSYTYPILLDRSSELVDYLSQFSWPLPHAIIVHDLLSGTLWRTSQEVDVALCDPPWYPEHYAAFLAQAASTLRVGGTVLVSLLPLNTRPQAVADRQQVFELAHRLGLVLTRLEPGALRYKTPLFERSSLTASGFPAVHDWRRGDLLTFIKLHQTSDKVIKACLARGVATKREDMTWREVLLRRHKIMLRGPFDDVDAIPALLPLEKDNVLPTVSRRYGGREKIDLWLWDNRVFAVQGKAAYLAALNKLAGRPVPETLNAVSHLHQTRAYSQLQQLLSEPMSSRSPQQQRRVARRTMMRPSSTMESADMEVSR